MAPHRLQLLDMLVEAAVAVDQPSLSRLWRDQSRAQEAHGLLAPIYDRFTEGFATADLRAAKALIDEITPTIPPFSTDASPAVLPLRP